MKPCHDNSGAMLERLRPCTILCFNILTTAEYLIRYIIFYWSVMLKHILKCIVVCARSRPEMLTKTLKFVRLHSHCLLLSTFH